jgi:cadmium resistance protein CadD (predicted permease)
MLIGITAITLIFGSPLLIVAAVLYANYRKKRLVHDTINQYVSSGKDVPAEVMSSLQAEVTPKSSLRKGLVLTGAGLGIIACFVVMGETEAAALGLIPLFIGLAQLLIWKLEAR